MKFLLTTAHPQMPELYGGAQVSGNRLATILQERGHEVAFLGGLIGNNLFGLTRRVLLKLKREKTVADRYAGYITWRTWFPWETMEGIIARYKPDLVIVLAGQPVRMARAAQRAGAHALMMLQDVDFKDHGGSFSELGDIPCVANSSFTAQCYRQAFGVDPVVIHPMVEEEKYRTISTRENVTFINPHPAKGVNIVLAVARACPDIPFSLYQSWTLTQEHHAYLAGHMKTLPNVTLHPPTKDMKSVYGKAKILMAPSIWEEAYGRVATEAQFSSIPVIAANRGGLPEAVGDGGILLNPEGPIAPWIEAVRRLWDDKAAYDDLAQKAAAYAQRPAINPEHQMDMWEQTLLKAIESYKTHA